ncbi:calcium-binding protein [Rickettsiales endosymbiont of Peranema trichophorum]|uniref:calcium-binding protein n=1 Tax=Rickettsiales endosymbiont of Peranema trichophorum TaxID=2486577 RepID=UPI0013EE7B19|nr:calcium-binding protein [Rickettsiales endosymbiont of Peranema trichophorum]
MAEFIVSQSGGYNKYASKATVYRDGSFVVVWESDGQDGSGYSIYGQRYGADGGKLGEEFEVNTYTTDHQRSPAIASLNNGDFVVVWESERQDGSGYGIYGRRYGTDGSALGSEFRINSYTTGNQRAPSITVLNNGDFVVVWKSDGEEGSGPGVYAQVYHNNGNKVGEEFKVSPLSTPSDTVPTVTKLPGSWGFIATYTNGDAVYATVHNPPGTDSDDHLLATFADDEILGLAGDDSIEGRGGADKIDGGEGDDTASYVSSPAGVQIDLTAATVKGGDADGDTLTSIENLIGSTHSDQLTGNKKPNVIHGQAGDDIIDGRAGADDLDGGDGNDTVTYRYSTAGVTVSLVRGVMCTGGDARGDIILNFENIIGSSYNDVLTGDDRDNLIESGGGDDTLIGGEGADVFKVTNANGIVRIKDFGQQDKLDLSEFQDIKNFDELENKMNSTYHSIFRSDLLINLGATEIILEGVKMLYENNVLYNEHSNIEHSDMLTYDV